MPRAHSRCRNASSNGRGAKRWSTRPGSVLRIDRAALATIASAPFGGTECGMVVAAATAACGGCHGT